MFSLVSCLPLQLCCQFRTVWCIGQESGGAGGVYLCVISSTRAGAMTCQLLLTAQLACCSKLYLARPGSDVLGGVGACLERAIAE
jgi:hypothetical protein